MPTQEELEAMVRLCVRTTQFLLNKEVDKNKMYDDEKTVWYYTQRVIEMKQKNREQANAWNKEHPDAHRKHCRDYARRKSGTNKEYQHEYYLRVTKPKRQAKKGDTYGEEDIHRG